MKVVSVVEKSIYRDEKGNPVNEILFSVTEQEAMYYLWVGSHKDKDTSHQDCLDVASILYWDEVCGCSIRSWLTDIYKAEKSTADSVSAEIQDLKTIHSNSLRVLYRIKEANVCTS